MRMTSSGLTCSNAVRIIPSVESLRVPDALDIVDAVKPGRVLVQCYGKLGPVGYDVTHVHPRIRGCRRLVLNVDHNGAIVLTETFFKIHFLNIVFLGFHQGVETLGELGRGVIRVVIIELGMLGHNSGLRAMLQEFVFRHLGVGFLGAIGLSTTLPDGGGNFQRSNHARELLRFASCLRLRFEARHGLCTFGGTARSQSWHSISR